MIYFWDSKKYINVQCLASLKCIQTWETKNLTILLFCVNQSCMLHWWVFVLMFFKWITVHYILFVFWSKIYFRMSWGQRLVFWRKALIYRKPIKKILLLWKISDIHIKTLATCVVAVDFYGHVTTCILTLQWKPLDSQYNDLTVRPSQLIIIVKTFGGFFLHVNHVANPKIVTSHNKAFANRNCRHFTQQCFAVNPNPL